MSPRPGTDTAAPPTWLELAGAFVLAAVVLHVVGMFPYFTSPNQAVRGVSARPGRPVRRARHGLDLALAMRVDRPEPPAVATRFSGGLAATELGFRVAILGDVFHYGTSEAGPGIFVGRGCRNTRGGHGCGSRAGAGAGAAGGVAGGRSSHARPRRRS